ncbi:tellurite resistance TerB family protein [Halovulum dunhuangense]|uniref:Tellurite resistance TerB family protein n=1 Tax=Halovulum dunhuangense TaxID=1505036 RepID=A0A849L3F1_9RHOB|nr:tellurite resistance TerB family protein [Halovulum dunhuangense]NNU80918.1 tellurite resistance TerB family protein [Halovulum dunhuangense]
MTPEPAPPPSFSAEDALVAVMIAASASDEALSAPEMIWILRIVESLPVFENYDRERIAQVSRAVFDLFTEEEGLDALFGLVRDALPESLFETAYALACDVIAADGKARTVELRLLEEIREELAIDRLAAAAIERGARARFAHRKAHGLA